MEIDKGIFAIDLGLWITSSKTLILSDFHLGYEEELNQKGVLIPRMLYKDIIDRLEEIFALINPETIVINGDIKHEFGRISKQEWQEVMRLLDYLERKCSKIVLIKGNHDTILGPIADKQNIKIVDEFIIDSNGQEILVTHGHKEPKELKKIIIIGHEHPAIGLQEDVRREKYKCYLVGKYKTKKLIVQPSFNLLTEGTDVLSQPLLSPFLTDITKFDVFVVDEKKKEILSFGRVGDLE
ncbi:metallophosphoesterase [Candidatus Woesearchaeota archaeon]|nr:metallophosphoesterase [Candidatus Woesearchaeota archaeon]